MILDGLHIANFKAIGTRQRVPLRPLTLIFGANSAGKSSILHALALAHNATQRYDLDVHGTIIGGDSIDLGGYRQYVHRRNYDQQVELAFELNRDSLAVDSNPNGIEGGSIQVSIAIGMGYNVQQDDLFDETVRELSEDRRVDIERFELKFGNTSIMSMSVRKDGRLQLDSLNYNHPWFYREFRSKFDEYLGEKFASEDQFLSLIGEIGQCIPEIWMKRDGLFPRVENSLLEFDDFVPAFFIEKFGWKNPALRRGLALWLTSQTLEYEVFQVLDGLNCEIENLRYLGPFRSYPPRHIAFSQFHDSNLKAGGGFAWDLVRTDEEIRRKVNHWLGDSTRLKTPYELQIQDLVPIDAIESQVVAGFQDRLNELLELVGDIEDDTDDSDDRLESIREALEENSDIDATEIFGTATLKNKHVIQDLVLIDKRTDTVVSHRDVGIGVSQVLPVLVSAFSSQNAIVAIEQPEIHLHPALQTDLADVFISSALGEQQNCFLLESHSEHLMLRILRRIRESSHGELPEDVPRITPGDVAVLYVEPDTQGVQVIEIPITEEGEFDRPWPSGFFAERAQELF